MRRIMAPHIAILVQEDITGICEVDVPVKVGIRAAEVVEEGRHAWKAQAATSEVWWCLDHVSNVAVSNDSIPLYK